MIPADLRLLETKDLFINQSALTGEAMPAEKFAHPCGEQHPDSPFDLPNLCFMGANVVSGYATGLVVRQAPGLSLDNSLTKSPAGASPPLLTGASSASPG